MNRNIAGKLLTAVVTTVFAISCGGGGSSPTTPTPTATPTRIISVTGDLAFGNVNLGSSATKTFTIANSGNSTLTFTGMTAVGGTGVTGFAATPVSGTVAAGASQTITLQFTPPLAQGYSNVLTIASDKTDGNNAINVSGTGVNNNPIFTRSGSGNQVFDMPTYVRRVRIQGTWNRTQTSNFIVQIGGSLVVNEILRDSITYDGTHLTTGGVVSITSSGQITWTFTEIR